MFNEIKLLNSALEASALTESALPSRPQKEKKHAYPLRAESPLVTIGTEEVRNFNALMNQRIDALVTTIKRWADGNYGTGFGEEAALATDMQHFAEVALDSIPAKFLVRVFSHLERGNATLLQSARGMISGATRKKPGIGPLEKAIEQDDSNAIKRYRSYLHIVSYVAEGGFKPLAFLSEWREELGKDICDYIIDDAAQYLKHHRKLLELHEKLEVDRKKALADFRQSKTGQSYLVFREEHCPAGLPRNRSERYKILNSNAAVNWKQPKKKATITAGSDIRNLINKNQTLSELVKADITYRALTKANTPPTWTPVARDNKRWIFIPISKFNGTLSPSGSIHTTIDLPQDTPDGVQVIPVQIKLAPTARLKSAKAMQSNWQFDWQDEISGQRVAIQMKGMRFESPKNEAVTARISYEIKTERPSQRSAELLTALKNKQAPDLIPGDIICTFSLEAVEKSGKKNRTRIGWFNTYGITQDAVTLLDSRPLQSTPKNSKGNRALRRGQKTFWGAAPGKNRAKNLPHAHGETDRVSLPQILDKTRTLRQEVRFLRTIKDPTRIDESIDWVSRKLTHTSASDPAQRRLEKLKNTLSAGQVPEANQLRPFKNRIRQLRDNVQGMKTNLRHSIAKAVAQTVQDVRLGKLSERIYTFQQQYKHPASEIVLLTEYHKGKGAGPYKRNATNRTLATLGASKIYELIEEKSAIASKPIPVFTISPSRLRKDCPAGDHSNATPPAGDRFICADDSCSAEALAVEVAAYNLARIFINPPAAKK